MRTCIVWLLALFICLQTGAGEALSLSDRLAETDPEKLASSIIAGSVHPITGEYYEEQTDLIASGKVPLVMVRVYGPACDNALTLAPGWSFRLNPQWDYLYDSQGQILEIRQLSLDKTQLLNWVRLRRSQHPEGYSELTLEACDGGICHYRFEQLDDKGPHLLTSVEHAQGHTLHYTYSRDPINGDYRLTRRDDANGWFLLNEYAEGGEQVIRQMAPIGVDETPRVAARFTYGDGWTEGYDAHDNKTIYRWSQEQYRVTAIESYIAGALYRTERFFWTDQKLTSYQLDHFHRTFAYDTQGNCIEIALYGDLSGTGHHLESYAIRYTYEEGTLSQVSEDNGRSVLFQRDLAGRVTGKLLRHEYGIYQRLFYEYDAFGYLTRMILDDGSSEYSHDLQDVSERRITEWVVRMQLPGAGLPLLIDEKYLDLETGIEHLLRTTLNTYDSSGKLIREEFFNSEAQGYGYLDHASDSGSQLSYTYDLAGRPIIKENHDLTTSFRYDLLGQLTGVVDSYGNENHYQYDAIGRCIETRFPPILGADEQVLYPTTQCSYDVFDRPIATRDGNGYITHTQYNIRGQPIQIDYPDGTNETLTYYLDGTLKTRKNRHNICLDIQRDVFGRVIEQQIVSAFGECVTSHAIYSGFRLLETLDTQGHETLYTYDSAGHLTSTYLRSNAGERTAEALLSRDQTLQMKPRSRPKLGGGSEQLHQNRHFINALGQQVLQTTVVDSNGKQEVTTYDACGCVATIEQRDALGQPVAFCEMRYDAAGNQVLVKALQTAVSDREPVFWISTRTYGPKSRLESTTEGLGTPQEATTRLTYNALGQLECLTKPDGCVLCIHYDGFGRVYEFFSSDGSIAYRYTYDEDGRPIRIEDLLHSSLTERRYDLLGHVLVEQLANGLTLQKQWDREGRPTHLQLPDESAIVYRYDDVALRSIHRLSKQGAELYTHAYQTEGGGNSDNASLIGGLGVLKRKKNDSGYCTAIESPYWSQTIFENDCHGKSRSTQLETADPSGTYAMHFTFDIEGRLTDEERGIEQLPEERGVEKHHYTYDALNNRIAKDSAVYEVNGVNQLTSTSKAQYLYNSNGNRVEKHFDGHTLFYQYDALDRLILIEEPKQRRVEYVYDPFHRRIRKQAFIWDSQQGWTKREDCRYLYDGQWEIGAVNQTGEIFELRVLGKGIVGDIGAAVAMEFNGQTYAPIHDSSGSVVCLVDLNHRQVAEYSRRTAFGEEQLFSGDGQCMESTQALNPWRFSSKRYDPDTGLIDYGRRFYDPEIGRWLTKDPLGFLDGLNTYAFVHNNPAHLIDVQGLFSLSLMWEDFSNAIYDAIRNTGDFASTVANLLYRDLAIFSDVQEQALLIGTQLIGPRIWDVIGFYAADPESGVYGQGEMSDRCRFSYVNGILNTREDSLRSVDMVSKLHGGVNIHYTYRPTAGWTWDIINACLVRVGYISPTAYCLANMWKTLIRDTGGLKGDGLIIHYAHSLGGAETESARQLLTPEEQKKIRVFVFGSPILLTGEGFESVTHFIARLDPVWVADLVNYTEGFLNLSPNINFVGSFWNIPLFDHLLLSDAYRTELERLGEKYHAAWTDLVR